MSITPEEIGRRFAPPRIFGEHYARKLAISDLAMRLADEVIALVPGSREQSRAIEGLEACVHWAHSGIDRRLDDAEDEPVPYLLASEPPAPHPVHDTPHEAEGEGVLFGRSVWELGIVSSQLPPLFRLVALVLSTTASDHDGHIPEEAQPTLPDLQRQTGLTLYQLHTILRHLEREGWITRETTRVGSTARTRYQLALPASPHAEHARADRP